MLGSLAVGEMLGDEGAFEAAVRTVGLEDEICVVAIVGEYDGLSVNITVGGSGLCVGAGQGSGEGDPLGSGDGLSVKEVAEAPKLKPKANAVKRHFIAADDQRNQELESYSEQKLFLYRR